MAGYLLALLFVLPASWGSSSKPEASPSCSGSLEINAPDVLALYAHQFANRIEMGKVKNVMKFLTGENRLWGGFRLQERYTPEARELTRQILIHTLRTFGLNPRIESFDGGANVVVEIMGTDLSREVLVLGAHFDTKNRHVPGANDNTTGVALLVHLAELFSKETPRRTVRIVFYDLEETTMGGSTFDAEQMKKDPRHFVGAYLVDMIGYFPKSIDRHFLVAEVAPPAVIKPVPSYFSADDEAPYEPLNLSHRSKLELRKKGLLLAREMFYQLRRLPVDRKISLSAETTNSDFDSGDHGSYWRLGLPALLFTVPHSKKFEDPYNHTYRDTVDHIDWGYYEGSSRLYAEFVSYAARLSVNDEQINAKLFSIENKNILKTKIPGSLIPNDVEGSPGFLDSVRNILDF